MTRAQEIRDHVIAHPGCTTKDIANAIGWTVTRVSAALWAEIYTKRPPTIRREAVGNSITNTAIYGYYPILPGGTAESPAPLVESPAPLVKRSRVKESSATAHLSTSLDTLANTLAKEFANQVASRVQAHLATALQGMLTSTHQAPVLSLEDLTNRVLAVAPPKEVKMAVVIAGLLPNQAGIISQEFADVFDLRFFATNDNPHQLKAMVKGADHVFTFTSKVSHALEGMIVSAGKKVHRCSGGMTMLKQQLLTLYADGDL